MPIQRSSAVSVSIILVMILSIIAGSAIVKPVRADTTFLSDQFTQDTTLNTNLWQVNGPIGTVVGEFLGASPRTNAVVTPSLAFSSSIGMAVTGVNSTFESSTIQSVQAFSGPFSAQAVVTSPAAFGNPFLLLVSSSDGGTGVGIAGNLNPLNAPFNGMWKEQANGPGNFWTGIGAGSPIVASPSINTVYTLGISVDSTGLATLSVSSQSNVLGTSTAQAGTGSLYLILAQYEGSPNPVGANEADWSSASVSSSSNVNSIQVGNHPIGVAFSPASGDVYVVNEGDNDVSVVNASNSVIATIPVGSNPVGVVYDPVNQSIYVSNAQSGTISIINSDNSLSTTTINVGTYPEGMVFDPANNQIYVGNRDSSTISVINANNNTLSTTIGASGGPKGLAFDPINNDIYAIGIGGILTVVSSTNAIIATHDFHVSPFSSPFGIAFDPANGDIYVADDNSNTVSVVDGQTNNVVSTLSFPGGPLALVYVPLVNEFYITNRYSGTVTVLDASTNTIQSTVTVGNFPWGIAFDPSDSQVYVDNYQSNTVSTIPVFPAGPIVPIGIANYVPIIITNNQPVATPSSFQQMVTVNNTGLASFEAQNLANVEFFYTTGTIIPSWLESGNSSSTSIFWLKLSQSIPAVSSMVIEMGFASQSTILFDGVTVGEALQLSGGNNQYDNGAHIFDFYDNFAGTTLSLQWNYFGSTGVTGDLSQIMVNNHLVLVPTLGTFYGSATWVAATSSATAQLTRNIVADALIAPAKPVTNLSRGACTIGCFNFRFGFESVIPNNLNEGNGAGFDISQPAVLTDSNNQYTQDFISPPPTLNQSTVYSVNFLTSLATFQINYAKVASPITTTIPVLSNQMGLFLSTNYQEISPVISWVRTRASPPNGVMPSTLVESTGTPTAPILAFSLHSPATLFVTDPLGRQVGFSPSLSRAISQIPGATYTGPTTEPQTVTILNPLRGHYHTSITGTSAGSYTLTITNGQLSQSVTENTALGQTDSFTVNNIPSQPFLSFDYHISSSPATRTISQGQSTSFQLSTSLIIGTTQPLSLSVTGLPSGTSSSFTPSTINAGSASTLFVTTSSTTSPGIYPLTISASAVGLIRSTVVTIIIPSVQETSYITDASFATITSFETVFTPDHATSTLKLVATNPGTFYFNDIFQNTGAASLTLTSTISIPSSTNPSLPQAFCLKGSVPIQIYSDLARRSSVTSQGTISITQPIGNANSESLTCVSSVSVTYTVPAGGLRYVTIHIEFAGKGVTGFPSTAPTQYHEGFLFSESTSVSTVTGNIVSSVPFIGAGQKATAIGGVALDTNSAPKSALTVKVFSGSTLIGQTNIGPDGFYFLPIPAGGPYTVQLYNPTTQKTLGSTTLQSIITNSYVGIDFQNLNPADPLIQGYILGADSRGIQGIVVQLYNHHGSLIAATISNAGGWYGFRFTSPGDYTVSVQVPSGYNAGITSSTVRIRMFQALTQDFQLLVSF